jgi:5-methylcytosine-specific restriction enzyme subunit McrC
MSNTKKIQVFEHHTLKIGNEYLGVKFETRHFEALAKLNQFHGNKYFTILHKAIKFSEYVGVVQIDDLVIEILPKIDKTEDDASMWQKVLIDMLKATKRLNVQNVGQANISKQNKHLLDIYFEWYLKEVRLLIHKGLIKKYYKQTANVKALKGKLEFAGHIQKNLIHKERFYTTHQVYDKDHLLHQVLNEALGIIEDLSKGTHLFSKCKTIQLDFPETEYIACTPKTFDKIKYNRKNAPYQKAIEIAKIIILNYAPNVTSGSERLLALLFDMNQLWEEYVLVKLKEAFKDSEYKVLGQRKKQFWNGITIRPDIVITSKNEEETFVIDTKWKNNKDNKASTQDLRQMYVYNEYWSSLKSMLLYPAKETEFNGFINFKDKEQQCGIGKLDILNGNKLETEVGKTVHDWFLQ